MIRSEEIYRSIPNCIDNDPQPEKNGKTATYRREESWSGSGDGFRSGYAQPEGRNEKGQSRKYKAETDNDVRLGFVGHESCPPLNFAVSRNIPGSLIPYLNDYFFMS